MDPKLKDARLPRLQEMFMEAGLSSNVATQYATIFLENEIFPEMFSSISFEVLRQLKLKLGHQIKIMEYAKLLALKESGQKKTWFSYKQSPTNSERKTDSLALNDKDLLRRTKSRVFAQKRLSFPIRLRPGTVALPRARSVLPIEREEVQITLMEYSATTFKTEKLTNITKENLFGNNNTIRWLNLEGFNQGILEKLQTLLDLHPVAIDNVLDVPQPPKVIAFDDQIFFILQLLDMEGDTLEREQVSVFVKGNLVITIQEGKPGDCWSALRTELSNSNSPLRNNNIEFLIYSMLDVLVDSIFPILSFYGDEIESYEELSLSSHINMVSKVNRELLYIRRLLRPTQKLVSDLSSPFPQLHSLYLFSTEMRTFLRDIEANLSRAADIIETYREVCNLLQEQYHSEQDFKMNQSMYTLTLLSTVFLPLSFLTGLYGMNFESMPEYEWKLGYLWFWGLVLLVVVIIMVYLKWRKMI